MPTTLAVPPAHGWPETGLPAASYSGYGKRIDIQLNRLDEVLPLHIPLMHVRSARPEPVPGE